MIRLRACWVCEHERRRWLGWMMAGLLTAVLYE